jgi:uncharacterized membrane protein YeaQ/YmgE (transglycosylase-associated protein family)
MSWLGWVILGLMAGWIGSHIVDNGGKGPFMDIALGVAGAVAGGFIFTLFGAHGVTGLNLHSLFVAVIGSVVVLVGYHALEGRR